MRRELGLTQERLAEVANVNPRYIQKLEAGKAQPSLMILAQIKTALRCEWNDLLQGVA